MVTSLTPLDSPIIIMNCTDPYHEKKDVGRQGGVMGSREWQHRELGEAVGDGVGEVSTTG